MQLTAWVDVAIGLSIVYIGASLFVTVVNEYIAQTLNLRGRQLCESLQALIDDKAVVGALAKQPAFKRFFDSVPGKAGSYVDPNVFARILLGSITTVSSALNQTAVLSHTVPRVTAGTA